MLAISSKLVDDAARNNMMIDGLFSNFSHDGFYRTICRFSNDNDKFVKINRADVKSIVVGLEEIRGTRILFLDPIV